MTRMVFGRKNLGDDEELVLLLRPHVKVLVVPTATLVLLAAVTGVLLGLIPDGSVRPWLTWIVVGLAVVVALRWVLWPFVVWRTTTYAITTRRLVTRRGVFSRSGHDMPLTRLNDVSFEHSLIERMIGCGTLVVESAGERGQLTFTDIPKVELVQRTLYELSDDARALEVAGRTPRPRDLDDLLDDERDPDAGDVESDEAGYAEEAADDEAAYETEDADRRPHRPGGHQGR
ncbi:MAG: PH domain-containing protein [Kineosporiaceae bacterium]